MRRILLFFVMLCLIITNFITLSYAQDELNLSAQSAVLMDFDSESIMYGKNETEKIFPASTTNILTAIVVLENIQLTDMVVVDPMAVELGVGSSISLEAGESLSVESLLHAMILESANDAAFALALHTGGSLGEFSKMMNDKAEQIGCTNSNFINPCGLHDEEHYSSAQDMAKIMAYGMRNETFRKLLSATTYTIPETNMRAEPRVLYTPNRIFESQEEIMVGEQSVPVAYPGVVGSKTGYSDESGNSIITMATRDDRSFIVAIYNAEGMASYADTHKLLNHGFENFRVVTVVHKNEFIDNFTVTDANEPYVPSVVEEDFTVPVLGGQSFDVERVVRELKVELPLSKGDPIAEVDVRVNGRIVGTVPVVTTIDVTKDEGFRLFAAIREKGKTIIIVIVVIIILLLLIRARQQRKKKQRLARLRRQRRREQRKY